MKDFIQSLKNQREAKMLQQAEEQRKREERLHELENIQSQKNYALMHPIQFAKNKKEIKQLQAEIEAYKNKKVQSKYTLGLVAMLAAVFCFLGVLSLFENAGNPPTSSGTSSVLISSVPEPSSSSPHIEHTWLPATCVIPMHCSICNATSGNALGHVWGDATCTLPKICSICNDSTGDALGHTWSDATCITPKVCSLCEAIEGNALGHVWKDATCQAPKTCSLCNSTEGELGEHSWEDATCTYPKTCFLCKTTTGTASGHSWENATCTSPKTCYDCGITKGSPIPHKYVDGECIYCWQDDPNYEERVWIPTNGGTKYHTKAGCSNMKNPIQIKLSDAIRRGYDACAKCH